VEWSKFCLFSVVLPVRCISSVSPRFYFRRHTFCFLPLAAILESLIACYFHVVIAGPQDSPFEGGSFKLELWRIPRWRLEVGSRKQPSYSEIYLLSWPRHHAVGMMDLQPQPLMSTGWKNQQQNFNFLSKMPHVFKIKISVF
jgi:hypothetical protein